MGKSPRKGGGKATGVKPTGGKNIQRIKAQAQKQYPKKGVQKVPKSTRRRFSLASESSLSSVSDEGRNFDSIPVFDSSSDEEEKNVEMNAIMGPSSESESDNDDDDDDDDDEDEFSSDDDSDVDFVALTKQRKAMKAAKARKNPRKSSKGPSAKSKGKPVIPVANHVRKQDNDEGNSDNDDEAVADVDFQFDFDKEGNETFKIGEKSAKDAEEEEDLGEEVPVGEFKLMDNSYDSNVLSENNVLKNHLMMDVPKIKEDELNSDEDYEIDDDKLIQTLQNDNDDLELAMLDDDDEDDNDDDNDESEPGEELLDANEFDNLSFEGEEDIDDYGDLIQSTQAEDSKNYLLKEEENAITKDFDDEDDEEGYLKYLSEESILFDDDDDENERIRGNDADDDSYGFGFFSNPFKDHTSGNSGTGNSARNAVGDTAGSGNSAVTSSPRRSGKRKFSVHNDNRAEFHWPYMEKLDDNSDSSSLSSSSDDEEEEIMSLKPIVEEHPAHSGDSTDEDTSLPKKATKKLSGSKMVAKEVLSTSETVPPLLGKWRTSDNDKPFSIIDGLSTRSLQPELKLNAANAKKNRMSKSAPKYVAASAPGDEPMALDELLNMSGLEDEDEVITEVDNVGFIFSKSVPLSAFRNKGYVPSSMTDTMDQLKKYSLTNKKLINKIDDPDTMRTFHGSKAVSFKFDENALKRAKRQRKREKRMQKLRRQSMVEAAKEGLRTTKSGLFSENTVADVEAFLADVETGDEFSILFSGVI